ncbi:MAG: hypothetical protein H6712_08940 [Myxococcales bacterium]|nr:hypothetical protein [Myxococcales bacterium]MCB9713966.1 hypothetical protein [Myxococcales bacterium]
MSRPSSTDHRIATRPARLALSIPDAGSSGIIDVKDLRADPPPLSLSPPMPSSRPVRTAGPRWPLAGLLTAVAASLTMVGMAIAIGPSPTVVVQQPLTSAVELAMHGAPEPTIQTAVDRERPEPATTATPRRRSAAVEPPEETTAEPAVAEAPEPAPSPEPRARAKAKTSKPRKTEPSAATAEPKAPSSIPVECVIDPSRCTTSGKPRASTGSSPTSPSGAALPAKLTASQLKAALASTKANARSCGPEHGVDPGTTVQVKLSIEGSSGTVVSATPQGEHAGDSLGRCVARALSQTQFPRFSASRMGTLYSVRL